MEDDYEDLIIIIAGFVWWLNITLTNIIPC